MNNIRFRDKVRSLENMVAQVEIAVFVVIFRRAAHIDGQSVFKSQNLAESVARRRQIAVAGYEEIKCQLFEFGAAQQRGRFECGS